MPNKVRMGKRRGFTTVELLTVIVILGVLLAVSFPRFSTVMGTMGVRSANREVAAYLVRARSAAIETGRVTRFIRANNTIVIMVDQPSGPVVHSGALDLGVNHGVSLTASRDTIKFDPRGFALGLGGRQVFVVSRGGMSDSVCIAGRGKVSASSCGL